VSELAQSSARVKYHLRDIVLRAGGLEVGTAELVKFATIGVRREGSGGIPHGFGDKIWKSNSREGDLAVVGVGGRGGGGRGWGGWGEFGSVENGANRSRGGGDDS